MSVLQTHAANIQASLAQNGLTPGNITTDLEQLLTDLFSALMSCFSVNPTPTPAQAQRALYTVTNPTRLQALRLRRMAAVRVPGVDPRDVVAAVQDEADATSVADCQAMMVETKAASPAAPKP